METYGLRVTRAENGSPRRRRMPWHSADPTRGGPSVRERYSGKKLRELLEDVPGELWCIPAVEWLGERAGSRHGASGPSRPPIRNSRFHNGDHRECSGRTRITSVPAPGA